MKTSIPFYHKVTGIKSDCGNPLDISLSSKDLNWEGILLERGTSPHFYPKDVVTPNFYFAIEMENTYSWRALKDGEQINISTEPGDIWINPPNTPFTHNIDVPCNFLILNISEKVMLDNFDGHLPEKLEFLNNYSIQDKTLENLIHLLFIEMESRGQNGKWFIDHAIKLFSNYFIRHYSNYYDLIDKVSRSSIIGPSEMDQIDEYIEENISLPIAIEDLANVLNVSKFHFLNEFKKYKGITPYQYILNRRIDRAKDMLRNPENKITTIAFELGFSDSSHFSRTFKKVVGLSPKSFREDY
ncbi:helix-turn-helix domain-containing protein [Acidaminobacter sp. JC074]|uniref:helix-turn-helix domain-containing protein n=1 Tax=Acidaminobacter sp. JC074 TaxID=2530199 RepID=UPI001F105A09|nr:helix-turn-helix domain-containing protein [Acidaminobacter sp. JC074]